MKNMKRSVALLVAIALLIGCAIGGTLAWLMDTSDTVINTFTSSDVNITLVESDSVQDNDSNANTNSYKMVPGATITKDPKVTVEAGSEDCWLFVKVVKSANYDNYLENYSVISDTWTLLTNDDIDDDKVAVYYYNKDGNTTATEGTNEYILAGDNNGSVIVKTTVTKQDMEDIKTSGMPTLTFTAYAVQQEGFATAADAWAQAKNL